MKIGILTLRIHSNFGFLMQAYALQKTLADMGCEPYTYYLKIEPPAKLDIVKSFVKTAINRILGRTHSPLFPYNPTIGEYAIIDQNTNAFVREHIQLTPYFRNTKELSAYDVSQFDAFVVGSDQVWRERYSLNIYTYFFDFLPEGKPRIAYAASFGTPVLDYSKKQRRICRKLISKFNMVTVREDDGVAICKNELGADAIQVLDPTLLLDKEEYFHLAERGVSPCHGEPYIFVYILDYTQHIRDYIDKMSRQYGLPIVNLLPEKYSESCRSNLNHLVYPSVYDLLRGFNDAEFVITDSFHGVAFSINLNKKFSVFINKQRGSSRITSILKAFGLESRVESDNFSEGVINFAKVNETLYYRREKSLNVIKSFVNELRNKR